MRIFLFLWFVAVASVAPLAQAQDDAVARSLAATCAGCHGTDGRSATREVMPLAGLSKDYITAQMKAFKDGSRPATIMHQLAKGYTDPQIESLAAYFAARK